MCSNRSYDNNTPLLYRQQPLVSPVQRSDTVTYSVKHKILNVEDVQSLLTHALGLSVETGRSPSFSKRAKHAGHQAEKPSNRSSCTTHLPTPFRSTPLKFSLHFPAEYPRRYQLASSEHHRPRTQAHRQQAAHALRKTSLYQLCGTRCVLVRICSRVIPRASPKMRTEGTRRQAAANAREPQGEGCRRASDSRRRAGLELGSGLRQTALHAPG